MPQAFFKNGSVIWAELTDWSSVTRFVTEKRSPFDVVANPDTTQQRPSHAIAFLHACIRAHIIGCVSSSFDRRGTTSLAYMGPGQEARVLWCVLVPFFVGRVVRWGWARRLKRVRRERYPRA